MIDAAASSIPAAAVLLLGESDCEELGDGLLAQPVNAVTSLAFSAVGLAVMIVALRARRAVLPTVVYGVVLVVMGAGSVLFHGPQTTGSQLLHDLPILWAVLFIVVYDACLLLGRIDRWPAVYAVAMVAVNIPSVIVQEVGLALTGAAVVTVVVLEVLVARSGRRNLTSRTQRRAYAVILVVAGLAGASWIFGRTDSPACDPDSILQLHSVWHLIVSAVFGLWWWLALWLPGDPDRHEEVVRSADSPDDLVPAGSDR